MNLVLKFCFKADEKVYEYAANTSLSLHPSNITPPIYGGRTESIFAFFSYFSQSNFFSLYEITFWTKFLRVRWAELHLIKWGGH